MKRKLILFGGFGLVAIWLTALAYAAVFTGTLSTAGDHSDWVKIPAGDTASIAINATDETTGYAAVVVLETTRTFITADTVTSYTGTTGSPIKTEQDRTVYNDSSVGLPIWVRARLDSIDGASATTPTYSITQNPGALQDAKIVKGQVFDGNGTDVLQFNTGSVTIPVLSSTTITAGTLNGTTITRSAQKYVFSAAGRAKAGTTSGWVVAAANNLSDTTLPQLQSGSTLIIPLGPFHVGDVITGFHLVGNIADAGTGSGVLDADLRAETAAASGPSDASIGSMTQLTAASSVALSSSNTSKSSLSETVPATKNYYMKITGTSGTGTTMAVQAVAVTVTEN